MNIGMNWTSPESFKIIKEFWKLEKIQYCELLLDNFLHLDPYLIKDSLQGIPTAFHIMSSRFIERDIIELTDLGKRLQKWVEVLQPIYVSDHIGKFTVDGRRLPLLMEIDYKFDALLVRERVEIWQDMLGEIIFFENFASTLDSKKLQKSFFEELIEKTNCGLLFDISNAVISEINCELPAQEWISLLSANQHCHIGGFRFSDTLPKIAIDTHDTAIAQASLSFLQAIRKKYDQISTWTITVERDSDLNYIEWEKDVNDVQQLFQYS